MNQNQSLACQPLPNQNAGRLSRLGARLKSSIRLATAEGRLHLPGFVRPPPSEAGACHGTAPAQAPRGHSPTSLLRISACGFLSDFGFRPSDFDHSVRPAPPSSSPPGRAILPLGLSLHRLFPVSAVLAFCALALVVQAGETVGLRPYELDWAGRQQDQHPALVDFEDLAGWRAEGRNATASFSRTREQQIWGKYVGKLVYRATGANPQVRILPPQPVPIAGPFDAVTLWCYGNNWGWGPDPSTPQVGLTALFEDAVGREFEVYLYHVDWTEWSFLHKRLTPAQIERAKTGAKFKGLLITNGRNQQDRTLYFDNLAVFVETFPPLQFEPRPARGIAMLPGESAGANTGPGQLPFPTQEQTIRPGSAEENLNCSTSLEEENGVFKFHRREGKQHLIYSLAPKTGTWTDLTVSWQPDAGKAVRQFSPCVGGGVLLQTPAGPRAPRKNEHLGTTLREKLVVSHWRLTADQTVAEVTYRYQLWGSSLVMDVLAPGGTIAEVRYGRAVGLIAPRLVTNPFYPAEGGRPAVTVSGTNDEVFFLSGNADWYLSGGSTLWAVNAITDEGVAYNGGTRYVPLTNGKRNDCFERFFLTVSARYEDVLPNIPNPPSPWRHVTGTRLWHAHGASDRAQDARLWTDVHRHGLTQVIVTDHETMWRDNGESFTFRTRAAPGKGGDQGAYDYARLMQDKLGFVYGPYNNYTDFAPVNEFWNLDMVARAQDNQLQHAWMRCYAPKPARAVEYCARLAPRMQAKFKFSTAYCDVHTAVAPWHRVDYDPRAPGAGTFAAVFYSFGEIMLHQKKAWNGPVYSEGNYHSFYMGLTDGNYGQDQSYRLAENPWLVDFDLRKMHDLGCNFGMGNPDMFYSSRPQPRGTPAEREAWLDRFLAATVAFGHPGFLVLEAGMDNALRSYYMLQQLHSRYCLTNATEIQYADATGQLLETSRAVATGAYKRSQVLTHYADGTITAANGSRTERMAVQVAGRRLDLPPNGYAGWTSDGAIDVLSGDPHGRRCDYAVTPAYLYLDGRGEFVRFAQAAGNGPGVCRLLPEGQHEIILLKNAECGFAVKAASAVALDKAGQHMGPAQLRAARGLTYVMPVKGAFSYLLTAPASAAPSAPPNLRCARDQVVPGETVIVEGRTAHELRIPPDAKPAERLWRQFEEAWIDFTVVPLAELRLSLDGNAVRADLTSHLPRTEDFTFRLGASAQRPRLEPGRPVSLVVDLGPPAAEAAEVLVAELRCGELTQRQEIGLLAVQSLASLGPWPEKWTAGLRLRGHPETADLGTTQAQVQPQNVRCGEVEKPALFMHPPWQGGVGSCFALYDPILLPAAPPAAFRAFVGKKDGSDLGDGVFYQVAVLEENGTETVAAQLSVTRHEWKPLAADLSRWAGRKVRVKLITDCGPKDNSSGDWGCWAEPRLETLHPVLHRTQTVELERLRHAPGPYPLTGLTLETLRTAKSGWLRYDGKGLEGQGRYATYALLNGLELGAMATAAGDEVHGKWSEKVGVPLTPEALRSLRASNHFVLRNPDQDCFGIRRFFLELQLADGRLCSSDISTATFTQPPGWLYAEGLLVPPDQNISVDIWFPGVAPAR